MGRIILEDMDFYAYHGCFAEEHIIGGRFLVNIEIDADTLLAENTDDISKTINYQEVYLLIKKEMEIKSKLLEHVASRIANAIKKQFPDILKIFVAVSKMNPPLGGKIEKVSFRLEK